MRICGFSDEQIVGVLVQDAVGTMMPGNQGESVSSVNTAAPRRRFARFARTGCLAR